MFLFAQRTTDGINNWLNSNPWLLGLIFVPLGGVLIWWGVSSLRAGVTTDKYGNEVSGPLAGFISVVRIIGGVIAVGFGLYKSLFG